MLGTAVLPAGRHRGTINPINHDPHRWTREQIRAAHMPPLLPLLQKRGLQLL